MLPARVAEECNRVVTQEFSEVGKRVRAALALLAKARGLDATGQFSPPVHMGARTEDVVDTRRALA